jgi:hypothetical protein
MQDISLNHSPRKGEEKREKLIDDERPISDK